MSALERVALAWLCVLALLLAFTVSVALLIPGCSTRKTYITQTVAPQPDTVYVHKPHGRPNH